MYRCFSYKQFPLFLPFLEGFFYFIGKVFFRRKEAVGWRCTVKKKVLNISQNSSESTCIEVFSFNKVAEWRPVTLLMRDFDICVFLWAFKKFLRTPFLQNICKRRNYLWGNIYPKEFLVVAYLAKKCSLNVY